MTSKKIRAALAVIIAAAILMAGACAKTFDKPLRLHIKANSNSEADQQVKLEVRDAVLEVTKDGIELCNNAGEAQEYIEKKIQIIVETANKTLAQSGFGYKASAKTGRFHFPEKSYKGVSYPEGEYEALNITLGEGEGDNWWCVMFPPLCISEIEDPGEAEYTSLFAQLWVMMFGS